MKLLLPYFIIIIIIIQIFLKRGKSNQKKRFQDFLDRESRANATRKQDISGLDYLTISDELPNTETSEELANLSNEVKSIKKYLDEIEGLKDKKILNLSGISNTDLKLEFGVANLTTLSEYDDNFSTLSRALARLGHELIHYGDFKDAIVFLEYDVQIGSDIKSVYEDLANFYHNNGFTEELELLKQYARDLDCINTPIILNYIDSLSNSTDYQP